MRVFIGLSGGVDSAVSASLLKEAGHEVVGVFIKIWQPAFGECSWRRDRLDAMRVAAHLGIPFRELDLSAEYERAVVSDLVAGYARGITPNPDVLCNRAIKFGAFAEWAYAEGAERVATGHYAQVAGAEGKRQLYRGTDAEKDQSYFLWQLGSADLERVFFPVGGLLKHEVRRVALRHALPVARKPDSQGVCFLGDVNMADFLKRVLRTEPGDVLDEYGGRIGSHDGAALYTLGQRHGFRIADARANRVPHFIVRIDTESNALYVSPRREKACRLSAFLEGARFVEGEPPLPLSAEAVVRYRARPVRARLARHREGLLATFFEPQLLSPGQSLVFYDGARVLGGGIIRC